MQRGMKANLIITHDCLCGQLETVLMKQNTGVSEVSNCFQLIKHLLVTTDFSIQIDGTPHSVETTRNYAYLEMNGCLQGTMLGWGYLV